MWEEHIERCYRLPQQICWQDRAVRNLPVSLVSGKALPSRILESLPFLGGVSGSIQVPYKEVLVREYPEAFCCYVKPEVVL